MRRKASKRHTAGGTGKHSASSVPRETTYRASLVISASLWKLCHKPVQGLHEQGRLYIADSGKDKLLGVGLGRVYGCGTGRMVADLLFAPSVEKRMFGNFLVVSKHCIKNMN